MTKFNPKNKKTLTYGEALGPAMEITDKEDARQYKAAYVAFIEKMLDTPTDDRKRAAIEMANSNLGYYSGYYSYETMKRVQELFECEHPILGPVGKLYDSK